MYQSCENIEQLLKTSQLAHKPAYILDEAKLRKNLSTIANLSKEANVEFILAFKAFALWKTFPIFREYIGSTTASSLNEARLAKVYFGKPAHTYSPAYTDDEFDAIADCSSHITFNSLTQYERFHQRAKGCSLGLRINPEYSEIGTLLYNPCAPGTRFGISADQMPTILPNDIEGFHCHCHCEDDADVLQRTLGHIEEKFGKWFEQLKWLNLGGGHLVTRKNYDTRLFVSLMEGLHQRYPWLKIILEPGSAFAWQTGVLAAHVVDLVEDKGIKTAILDVSFTCHMPDCLEMPYKPEVRHATLLNTDNVQEINAMPSDKFVCRLGGNSCLSGDVMGYWQFDHPLAIGDSVIFEDMIHYTTVKTCLFNGIGHPALALLHENQHIEILKEFDFEDYLNRMD